MRRLTHEEPGHVEAYQQQIDKKVKEQRVNIEVAWSTEMRVRRGISKWETIAIASVTLGRR